MKDKKHFILREEWAGGFGMSAVRYYRIMKGKSFVTKNLMFQLRAYRTKLYLRQQSQKKEAIKAGCFYDFLHSNV